MEFGTTSSRSIPAGSACWSLRPRADGGWAILMPNPRHSANGCVDFRRFIHGKSNLAAACSGSRRLDPVAPPQPQHEAGCGEKHRESVGRIDRLSAEDRGVEGLARGDVLDIDRMKPTLRWMNSGLTGSIVIGPRCQFPPAAGLPPVRK
jgi:hypothetical protein